MPFFYDTHIIKGDQGDGAHVQGYVGHAGHHDDDINNDVHDDVIVDNVDRETYLRRLTALQLLRLREERKLTYVSCSHALEVMANVVSTKDDLLQAKVHGICQPKNINADVSRALQEAIDQNTHNFQSVVDEFAD